MSENENKQALMKIFSAVLKERSKSESEYKEISPEILKFFSRKELIEIITNKIFNGQVPPEHNLVEMENSELLRLIGDDIYIIAYMTEKWCEGVLSLPSRPTFEERLAGLRKPAKETADQKKEAGTPAEKKETPNNQNGKKD